MISRKAVVVCKYDLENLIHEKAGAEPGFSLGGRGEVIFFREMFTSGRQTGTH